jgi:hypothetical protein
MEFFLGKKKPLSVSLLASQLVTNVTSNYNATDNYNLRKLSLLIIFVKP